jgi:hypothetical protein
MEYATNSTENRDRTPLPAASNAMQSNDNTIKHPNHLTCFFNGFCFTEVLFLTIIACTEDRRPLTNLLYSKGLLCVE